MATLIRHLRAACSVGTADYSINGVAYWTDDQLQTQLDRVRNSYIGVPLEPMPIYDDGETKYFDYAIPVEIERYFEESGVGSNWAVKDSTGADAPSNTPNYDAGIITFAANTGGTAFYLDLRSYNLNRAAAQVWTWKAANRANRINWESDNHKMSAAQEYEHCMEQAKLYRKMAGVQTSTFDRVDEAVWNAGD